MKIFMLSAHNHASQLIYIYFFFKYFFLYTQRQIELRRPQNRGGYIYRQYTKRVKPRLQKERKKLERNKSSHHANHPKNSKKRENLNPKTDETTLEVNGKGGSPSFGLTTLPLETFFGFALPKYTKKDK